MERNNSLLDRLRERLHSSASKPPSSSALELQRSGSGTSSVRDAAMQPLPDSSASGHPNNDIDQQVQAPVELLISVTPESSTEVLCAWVTPDGHPMTTRSPKLPSERRLVAMRPSPSDSGLDLTAEETGERRELITAATFFAESGLPKQESPTEPFPAYVEPDPSSYVNYGQTTPAKIRVQTRQGHPPIGSSPNDDRLSLLSQAYRNFIPHRLSHRQTLQHVAAVFQPRGTPDNGAAAGPFHHSRSVNLRSDTDSEPQGSYDQLTAQERGRYMPYNPGWGLWSEGSSQRDPMAMAMRPAPVVPGSTLAGDPREQTTTHDCDINEPYHVDSGVSQGDSWYDQIQTQMAAEVAKWGLRDSPPDSIAEGEALAQESEKYVPYIPEDKDQSDSESSVPGIAENIVSRGHVGPVAEEQTVHTSGHSGGRLSRPRQDS